MARQNTFHWRQLLIEDICQTITYDGRWLLMEDNRWWRMPIVLCDEQLKKWHCHSVHLFVCSFVSIYNTCNFKHLEFATHEICNTCNLKNTPISTIWKWRGMGEGKCPVIPPVHWKGDALPQQTSRTLKTLSNYKGFYSVFSAVERFLYLRDFFYYFDIFFKLWLRDFLNRFFKDFSNV